MRRHLVVLVVFLLAGPAVARAQTSWIFAPAHFSHDPATGQRVTQYSPAETPYFRGDPTYLQSGYRHNRISFHIGDTSDNLHIVETWGAGESIRPYGEWLRPFREGATPFGPWGNPQGPWTTPYGTLPNPQGPWTAPYGAWATPQAPYGAWTSPQGFGRTPYGVWASPYRPGQVPSPFRGGESSPSAGMPEQSQRPAVPAPPPPRPPQPNGAGR